MEVVINIPEELAETICEQTYDEHDAWDTMDAVRDAIRKDNILPKGHGALKDADKLAVAVTMIRDRWNCYGNEYESAMYQAYDNSVDEIIDAPTIIEADKEVDE